MVGDGGLAVVPTTPNPGRELRLWTTSGVGRGDAARSSASERVPSAGEWIPEPRRAGTSGGLLRM
jgi:hypothetical protein